jgi:hypothetical protein
MIEINYLTLISTVVVTFILGALWYSPLIFGKWWMQIMEKENVSKEELSKMEKEMSPFYFLQLILTIVKTFGLLFLIKSFPSQSPYIIAVLLGLFFIIPIQIESVIWANTKKKFWCKQIFVATSYTIVSLLISVFILTM